MRSRVSRRREKYERCHKSEGNAAGQDGPRSEQTTRVSDEIVVAAAVCGVDLVDQEDYPPIVR